MSFAYLLNVGAPLATFRQNYSILEVMYCHESEIALHREEDTAFFPLMSILKGRAMFLIDLLLINALRYYGLCPD